MNGYRLIILALSGFLLSSCDWKERLDVADVNARNAIMRIQELESRVNELERKVRNLETR